MLVRKATATIPHGGGRKFAVGSPDRRTLGRKAEQQLRVEARYADGRVVDVTRLAQDTSNSADLATVDSLGLVKTLENVGEAAIMIRDGGEATVARGLIPLGRSDAPSCEAPASTNLVDTFVFRKVRELGLVPSAECSDAAKKGGVVRWGRGTGNGVIVGASGDKLVRFWNPNDGSIPRVFNRAVTPGQPARRCDNLRRRGSIGSANRARIGASTASKSR